MKSKLERAKSYVSKMEPAIERSGGDKQTFVVCCKLVEFGLSPVEASEVLREFNERCKPKWSDAALTRKLKAAFLRASPSSQFTADQKQYWRECKNTFRTIRKWPETNRWMRSRIIQSGPELSGLLDLSPVVLDSKKPQTTQYLKALFPGDPLICVGKNMMEFWTRRVSDFGRSVENFQFIVPSPMSKLIGRIQEPSPGKPEWSAHTLDNTGERRYAVIEFDEGSYDEHASLIWHLADFAPLVLAVHSGGKSIHGWFSVCGDSEEDVFKFYRYAVSLGADYHTFLKSQFVRMPDGRRENGKRQEVFYFNPEAVSL